MGAHLFIEPSVAILNPFQSDPLVVTHLYPDAGTVATAGLLLENLTTKEDREGDDC